MPFALVGLLSSLALWDFFKFSDNKWGLNERPLLRLCLIRTAQCGELALFSTCVVVLFQTSSARKHVEVVFLVSIWRKTSLHLLMLPESFPFPPKPMNKTSLS